jgi:hypothetical protein
MKKGLLVAVMLLPVLAAPALGDGEPTPLFNLWGDFSFQSWWLHGSPAPAPLVTTGPLPGGPGGFAPQLGSGIPGQEDTAVLYGGDRLAQSINQGFKVTLGAWLDYPAQTWAVEGSFFYLAPSSINGTFSSDANGFPLLARPVTDAGTNTETVLFVSAPAAFTGGIAVDSTTSMLGGEANALYVAERWESMNVCGYFNLLAGFRYLDLHDDLDIVQNTGVLPEGVAFFAANPGISPTQVHLNDNFNTRNDFYGGQVGAQLGWNWWFVNLSLAGKVALGGVHQQVDIGGSTTFFSPLLKQPLTTAGGLLTQPSNIGSYHRNVFAVLPSLEANLTFEITAQIHLLVGYQFLYLSDVARPGNQIDPVVNRDQLPTSQLFNPALSGPARPEFHFHSEDFWAQGLTLGLSIWF